MTYSDDEDISFIDGPSRPKRPRPEDVCLVSDDEGDIPLPPSLFATAATTSQTLTEKKAYLPRGLGGEEVIGSLRQLVEKFMKDHPNLDCDLSGCGTGEEETEPLHVKIRGFSLAAVYDAQVSLKASVKALAAQLQTPANASPPPVPEVPVPVSRPRLQRSRDAGDFWDPPIPVEVTRFAIQQMGPGTAGLSRAQVIQVQEERAFGVVRTEKGQELYFKLRAVAEWAYLCRGDLVEVEEGHDDVGPAALSVRLMQEAVIRQYTPELVGCFVQRATRAPLRNTLIYITQRPENWGTLLDTPMPSSGEGMLPRHVLSLLEFSSRVSQCRMKTAMRIYFNSFLMHRTFIESVVPKLLHSQYLSDTVLRHLAQFGAAVKRVAGLERGLQLSAHWVHHLQRIKAANVPQQRLIEAVIEELLSERTEAPEDIWNTSLEPDPHYDPSDPDLFSILPQHYDFLMPSRYHPHNLPVLQPKGSYESILDYCRQHYKLMKAECFSELVHCINYKYFATEAQLQQVPEKIRENVLRTVRFYTHIHIAGVTLNAAGSGLCYTLLFRSEFHQDIRWAITKVLDLGNLLVFTADRFKSKVWWAVVADRSPALLQAGIVSVRFLQGDPAELQRCLTYNLHHHKEADSIMAEGTVFFTAFHPVLEAIRAITCSPTPHLSFTHALVHGKGHAVMPAYLDSPNRQQRLATLIAESLQQNTFDEGQRLAVSQLDKRDFILVQGPPGTGKSYTGVKMGQILAQFRGELLDEQLVKSYSSLSALDEEHSAAVRAVHQHAEELRGARRHKEDLEYRKETLKSAKMHRTPMYSKVQKEVLAAKAEVEAKEKALRRAIRTRTALASQRSRRQAEIRSDEAHWAREFGPLVVVTYKNHSLDEFLMDMLKWLDGRTRQVTSLEGVVRIGSRSRCKELDAYNLRELTHKELLRSRNYHRRLQSQLVKAMQKAQTLANEILQNCTLTPAVMQGTLTEEQRQSFGPITPEKITEWLYIPGEQCPLQVAGLYQNVVAGLKRVAEDYHQQMALEAGDAQESNDDSDDEGVARHRLKRKRGGTEKGADAIQEFWDTFSPLLPDMPYSQMTPEDQLLDLWKLSMPDRQALAGRLLATFNGPKLYEYQQAKEDFLHLQRQCQELLDQVRQDVLRRANVIGITTTGAAIHRDLLQALRPSIMIVEEAAEILESQLLSCLANIPVQQIILIGDHKQLRPVVQCYEHSRYNHLDLSMFERMEANGVPCIQLTTQRRMTPQICQFVMPIYPNQLVNDASVENRKLITSHGGRCLDAGQDIPGLCRSIYFWDHSNPEERSSVGRSWMNALEIRMATALAHHLLTVGGIQPSQLTILTPYKGQMKELRSCMGRGTALALDNIMTVDRYQGDENDVVILSLVRAQHLTEFIKRQDRMVVALSRARHALYVLGCSELFRKHAAEVPHWMVSLREFEMPSVPFTADPSGSHHQIPNIGTAFPICCPIHPTQIRYIPSEALDDDPLALSSFQCPVCRPIHNVRRLPSKIPYPPYAAPPIAHSSPLTSRPLRPPLVEQADDDDGDDIFIDMDNEDD